MTNHELCPQALVDGDELLVYMVWNGKGGYIIPAPDIGDATMSTPSFHVFLEILQWLVPAGLQNDFTLHEAEA